MKKAFCMAMMFMAVTFLGSAADASQFGWEAAAGLSVPLQSGNDLGFGGEASGLLDVGSGLDLTGTVGYYTHGFTGGSVSYTDIYGTYTISGSLASLEVMLGLKYKIGNGAVKPYILAQGGISDLMNNTTYSYTSGGYSASNTGTNISSVYPAVAGGVGVEIGLGAASQYSLIIQAKVADVFSNGSSFAYLPICVGVSH